MKKESGLTNLIVIIMSIIFAGMSALMIFVDGVAIEYLIYAICAAAVIVGIVMIVRYFTKDAYKNVNAYGFSIGTLFVILGICGLLRVNAMAGAVLVILGIVLLLAGIIMLQHSLDLYRMGDVLRIPTLILAVAVLVCAIMAILQPFQNVIDYSVVIWWMILVSGGISFIINIYTLIKVKLYEKKENAPEDTTGNENTESGESVGALATVEQSDKVADATSDIISTVDTAEPEANDINNATVGSSSDNSEEA